MPLSNLESYLGPKAKKLLSHVCRAIPKEEISLPGADWIARNAVLSDKNNRVLGSLHTLFHHGNLKGTGYLSILPVDQGVEHFAGASFSRNPDYFDPEKILQLAIEGGCNGIASTLGILGSVARRYAYQIPFILKLNHNELLTYPTQFDQIFFASVQQAWNLGCVGVGATIYFGSPESKRQIVEVSHAFEEAHRLGMFTMLWCYLRNPAFKAGDCDYHVSADLTGQANYLGATLQADIVKQKLPKLNGGVRALKLPKFPGSEQVYTELTTSHPIDLVRYQVANAYKGRVGMINSGGASLGGDADINQVVEESIINKRGGGWGIIAGRKAFQHPLKKGIEILHAIQEVYLCDEVTIA